MNKFKGIIILIFILCINIVYAQKNQYEGTVIDSKNKQALAFVNITYNDDGKLGTTTDIDGKFVISNSIDIQSITLSFVGYQKLTLTKEELNRTKVIKLTPSDIELDEVVVYAEDNPAHRIIDNMVKNRKRNNINSLESYSYTMYDRIIITIDTTDLSKISADIKELVKNNDIMVMETVSEQYHKKPNKNKKIIKANTISGLNNPMYFYLVDNIQSLTFYEDNINIFGTDYLNPISKDSKKKYFFNLESVIPETDNDTVFLISFKTRKNANINGLQGIITTHSKGWAIANVKASPIKTDIVADIRIQQLYERVSDSIWFPKQLNTNIIFLKEPVQNYDSVTKETITDTILMTGIGKSYLKDIKVNNEISDKIFDFNNITLSPDAGDKDMEFWALYRNDSINERVNNTYTFVDSLLTSNRINLDLILNTSMNLIENQSIPIGVFNIKLDNVIRYDIINNLYLGLGFGTNNKLSRIAGLDTYFGYWFGAKEMNYGVNGHVSIIPIYDTKLTLGFDHRFNTFGEYGFYDNFSILNNLTFKDYFVKSTTLNTGINAEFSTYITHFMKGFVKMNVGDRRIRCGYSLINDNTDINKTYRIARLDMKLRIAFGEVLIFSNKQLKAKGKASPEIWLMYSKGLKGFMGSEYNYDKVQLQFRGKWQSKVLGKTELTIQGGMTWGIAPLFEYYDIAGTSAGFNIMAPESFSTMRPDEFLCNRFALLFFTHNFGNLMKIKKFQPELAIAANIGWGDMTEDTGINDDIFKSMDKGYYESGLIIDKILNVNFIKLGFGVYYRFGPYGYDKTGDNFSYKITANMNF